jgi:hypothetical protein
MIITEKNYTKFMCARSDIPLDVEVYDLEVYVYDKTGRYLLNSTDVFFGPYPLASVKRAVPVALYIPDTSIYYGHRYWTATRLYVSRGFPYFYIQTSYAVVGLSGVRQIYEDAAKEYFEKMRKAACVKPYDWYSAAYYYSFAAFYNYVANSSSYGRSAIFRISSVQPKYVPYICDMSSDVPGAREFARLFLRGQRYRFMVWYLGYKVFDGWVTINSTKIKLLTDAVPVKIETLTKSARLPVDSYVGITFADALAGLAYKNLPTFENATTLLQPFEKALSVISDTLNLLNKDPEKQYIYHSPTTVYKDGAVRRFGDVMPFTRGIEYSLPFAMMLFRNLTDPLKAGISRDRLPYYPRDGVIHGAVMLPATSSEYYENISKVEASWYNRSYTGFYELAVAVNGRQSIFSLWRQPKQHERRR